MNETKVILNLKMLIIVFGFYQLNMFPHFHPQIKASHCKVMKTKPKKENKNLD